MQLLKNKNGDDGDGGCPTHRLPGNLVSPCITHSCLVSIHGHSAGKTDRPFLDAHPSAPILTCLNRLHVQRFWPEHIHFPLHPMLFLSLADITSNFTFLGCVRKPPRALVSISR